MKVARPRPPLPLPNSESCFVTHFHILVSYTPRTKKKSGDAMSGSKKLSLSVSYLFILLFNSPYQDYYAPECVWTRDLSKQKLLLFESQKKTEKVEWMSQRGQKIRNYIQINKNQGKLKQVEESSTAASAGRRCRGCRSCCRDKIQRTQTCCRVKRCRCRRKSSLEIRVT